MSKILQYPSSKPNYHVALSLSLVLLGFNGKRIEVLLAKSKNPEYEGELFLPSQNLLANEDFREAIHRIAKIRNKVDLLQARIKELELPV